MTGFHGCLVEISEVQLKDSLIYTIGFHNTMYMLLGTRKQTVDFFKIKSIENTNLLPLQTLVIMLT